MATRPSGRTLLSLASIALLAAASPLASEQPTPAFEEVERLTTRYGPVIVSKSDADTPRWRVAFADRTLLETEFDGLALWERFEGDDGHDYVIVQRSSGGIACPYQFRVVDAGPKNATIVSEEFGSCLEPKRTRLYGNALVLDMPFYVPHPELIDPPDLPRLRQTTQIFTVIRGRITTREEVRK